MQKAGLSSKYSILSFLNQDEVTWPFPTVCNMCCRGPRSSWQGQVQTLEPQKPREQTSGPACSWTLRTMRTWGQHLVLQLLEPENQKNEKMEVDSPNLPICGRCLCNDRTGLWGWHGLLNHNAGVVVWHPCVCQLVGSRSCHCCSNCVMHGDIL